MDAFFFGYTMAILALCLISSVYQWVAFDATKRKPFAAAGLFFLTYFVELGVIFLDEFLHQNIAFPLDSYYAITYPLTRTLIACVLWGSLWAYVLLAVERFTLRRLAIPIALFFVAQGTCLLFMPYGALRQFCYYTCRQVFCLFMALYGLSALRRAPTSQERQWLGRHRWLMWVLLAEVVLVCLEDALVILVLPPAKGLGITLYLSERNFCENAMVIVFAFFTGRIAWRELSFRMHSQPQAHRQSDPAPTSLPINPSPATGATTAARTAPTVQPAGDATFSAHVDELMPRFGADHDLTPREEEVLVLAGRTNQQIAEALVVSVGTVKTHVYNIVHKCDVGNRAELKTLFWPPRRHDAI